MTSKEKRILIVEANPVMREGLKSVINRDARFVVAADTANPEKVHQLVDRIDPDLILIAVQLPGTDGIALTRQILAQKPQVPIMIVNMHPDIDQIRDALWAGAMGYAVKESTADRLLEGIERILEGEYYLDGYATRSVVERLIDSPSERVDTDDPAYASLTEREREIFRLLAEGFSNEEVARHLNLQAKTVCNHRTNLTRKLSIKGYTDLVRYACRMGVIDPAKWLK
ncbi:MAG: response regulator transcription factor [Desulfobacterales bacterium]|nr:response regulator transcription factor [Desulfobacterales bacterium]